MSVSRKNARRLKHGRQGGVGPRQRRLILHAPPKTEPDPLQAAVDRARSTQNMVLTGRLRDLLEAERKRYHDALDRLKARTRVDRKKLDDAYGKDLNTLADRHDKERRKLEREHDQRRQTILTSEGGKT